MKNILLILLSISFTCSAQEKVLFKVGFGEHNNPPYAIIKDGKLVSGIIKDITEAIAKEINLDVEYIYIPKKRQERFLLNQKIDSLIISNEKWLINSDKFHWSQPLFLEQDILVTNTNKPFDIKQFSDLEYMSVGTIHGYFYPSLEDLFAKGKLIRSDVKSLNLNFSRLHKGWIDSFVDSNILIRYRLQRIEQPQQYKISSLIIKIGRAHV